MYELPNKLPNYLKTVLKIYENLTKIPIIHGHEASAQPTTRNENFDSCARKLQEITSQTYSILPNFEDLSTAFGPRLH